MRTLQTLSVAVLVTAISAATLTAQGRVAAGPRPNGNAVQPPNRDAQPPQVQRQARGQGRDGIRAGRSGPAANVLRLKEQLNLSDEQIKQLESINANGALSVDRAEMMRAQADLVEARKGDINIDKAKAAYDRMARLKTDQQVAQLKVQQDVRKVLTTEQRGKVDQFSKQMQSRRGAAVRARAGARGQQRGVNRAGPPRAGAPRPGAQNGNRGVRRPPVDGIR